MKTRDLLDMPMKRTERNYVQFKVPCPSKPLEMLEFDIKHIYIYGQRRFAYVLSILDTFTRVVLHRSVGYSMKTHQVKEAWEYVISEYLQGNIDPNLKVVIQVRSDNGKQFTASDLEQFFKDNNIDHVCTHPYTPEENGHIESFHSILSKSINDQYFNDLNELISTLDVFYDTYNNNRSHSGISGLPPNVFWDLYDMNLVEVHKKNKWKNIFRIKIPYQEIMSKIILKRTMHYRGKPSPSESLHNSSKQKEEVNTLSLPLQKNNIDDGAKQYVGQPSQR